MNLKTRITQRLPTMPSNTGNSKTNRTTCPPRRPRNNHGRRAGKSMMTPRNHRLRPMIDLKTSSGHDLKVPVTALGFKKNWNARTLHTARADMTVKFKRDGGADVYVNTLITKSETRLVGHYEGDTKGRTPAEIATIVANNSTVSREMLDALDELTMGGCGTKTVTLPPLDASAVRMPKAASNAQPRTSRSAWTPPISTVNRTATRQ